MQAMQHAFMNDILTPALAGFALGGSLIIAIGAQNAFILRMGLLRQHVFVLCLICALADALLIAVGVAGLGAFVDRSPQMLAFISAGGAVFLFSYAFLALKRALFPSVMVASDTVILPVGKAIAICLAFTFLNPHVYLDTVVLVGSLASVWQGTARFAFGVGAILASFVWFFGLGYGARLLQPIFAREISWRILDGLIALVMALLGASLVSQFFAATGV